MSEIKTLEDMRNTVKTIAADCDEGWILGCLDAIESEIAERYMELPVDADGVPIRVGDEVCGYGCPDGGVVVKSLNGSMIIVGRPDGAENYAKSGLLWAADSTRHYNAPTVEDVLREFAYKVCDLNIADCDVERYAAEIRELLGVSAND